MNTILEEAAAGRAAIVRWTVEQYHHAIRTGVLPEDPSLELLDGFIVRKDRAKAGEDPMTIGDRHRIAVIQSVQMLGLFPPVGSYLQSQQPISLPPESEPEPDVSIVRGTVDQYRDGPPHAADVTCVVEVSDNSLRVDLGPKLRAYVTAGIPQYIVVDLVHDVVIVHEEPHGEHYARVARCVRGETLRVRGAIGDVTIDVDRLLP